MSPLQHDTLPPLSSQLSALIGEQWEQEVLCQLPTDYEHQARTLGAFVRLRGLRSVGDLLRGLLAYVLCAPSLRQLGAWAVLIGLANLSHVAWHKRLQAARDWLLWLLQQRLAVAAGPALAGVSRLIQVDGTRVKEVGGSGDDWRLHLAYDLLGGQLVQVKLSDRHSAEGFTLFDWRPGDLVVADRGYSRRGQLAHVLRAGAQVLVRLAPQKVPLLSRKGEPFEVQAWLQKQGPGQHSVPVAFAQETGTFLGRLVACSLPEDTAERARVKERKRARKKQRVVSQQTLFFCGWLLVFTSLPPSTWPDEQVLTLYRARWQIELLIKRFKQLLRLVPLRGKTALSNEATLLALLVAWSFIQTEAQHARELLSALVQQWSQPEPDTTAEQDSQEPTEATVSSWSTTALAVQSLRVLVQGFWTPARLRTCLPYLARFLCSRQRRRHQESHIRQSLLAHPALQVSEPSLLFFCSSA